MSRLDRRQQLRRMGRVHVAAFFLIIGAVVLLLLAFPVASAGAATLAALLQLHSIDLLRTIVAEERSILP